MTTDFPPPTGPENRPATQATDGTTEGAAIVAVSLDSVIRAQEFLLAMSRLKQNGSLALTDAVIVTKDEAGDTRVVETMDPTPARSAFSGAVWTGLLGLLLGGPVGWLAGVGVGAGGGAIAAKVIDLGIPDEWVAWFKQAVRPGTSTVVVLLDDVDLRALNDEAARFRGAELLHTTLPPAAWDDLTQALAPGAT
ncbi:MAG: DUF1269 domain-containing protein [Ilumatobacter sp.]|nr:DUF1269 domain-containing protein [Ilumatobacter sp.]